MKHSPQKPGVPRGYPHLWLGCALGFAAPGILYAAQQSDSAPPPALKAAPAPGSIHQQADLDELQRTLMDAKAAADARRAAAAALIDRPWPAAISIARRALLSNDDGARRAVAQALADSPQPPADLLGPLLNALDHEDGLLRLEIAAALARYPEPTLADQLIAVAANPRQNTAYRLGAITALAEHRTQNVASALLKLAQDPDGSIQAAAYESLSQLTGRRDLGTDGEAWNEWWSAARRLKRDQWLSMIVDNLARRNMAASRELAALSSRLLSAHQQAYDIAAESERPAILLKLLEDPMPDLRQLALMLIERRVLNAQPVGPEVRAALRAVAFGPVLHPAHHRIAAAHLLENLADTEAAALAVEKLLGEGDSAVQSAFLSLLARSPRAEAVKPALALIDQPALRSAAAMTLVAAADAKLLPAPLADQALAAARRHAIESPAPDPAMLQLLGRVGQSADDALIERQLLSSEAAVKLAAAESYLHGQRSIQPLLDRAEDPILRPVMIRAVALKGATSAAIQTLLIHPVDPASPAADQVVWQEAILAAAPRLSVADLETVDRSLASDSKNKELREAVLRAAAGSANAAASVPLDPSDARSLWAALRLAAFYQSIDQPAKAKAVYERIRIADWSRIAPDQRPAYFQPYATVMVDYFPAPDAAEVCRKALAQSMIAPDLLAGPWLDSVERREKAGQLDGARNLITLAVQLFDGKLPAALHQRLLTLKSRLLAAAPSN